MTHFYSASRDSWNPLLVLCLASLVGCTEPRILNIGGSFLPMQGDVQLPSGSQEASVNVTVTFVNLGDASLRILGATTSCACALAKNVEEQSLLPGEKLDLHLTVIPPPNGTKHVRLDVLTSPPSPNGYIVFAAKGRPLIAPYIDNVSEEICIQYSESGAVVSGRGFVTCVERLEDSPCLTQIKLDGVLSGEWSETLITPSEYEPYTEPGLIRRTYGIEISGIPNETARSFERASVTITSKSCNEIRQEAQKVRVIVRRVESMRAVPNRLKWSVGALSLERPFLLVFDSASDWTVGPVNGVPAWLDVVFDKVESDSSTQRIKVVLRALCAPTAQETLHIRFAATSSVFGERSCILPVEVASQIHSQGGN